MCIKPDANKPAMMPMVIVIAMAMSRMVKP